jgi:hypothetical protein
MSDDALIKSMSDAAIKNSSKIGLDPEEWIDVHIEVYDSLVERAPN